MLTNVNEHWQHTEYVENEVYEKFRTHSIPITPQVRIESNIAVFIENIGGGKRLEGVYDETVKGIRPLRCKDAPNRDLRLYIDALRTPEFTMIAVDGLMGTGKTSTCVRDLITRHLSHVEVPPNLDNWHAPSDAHRILIAKPNIMAGGEDYGFLPGDLDEKMEPSLASYSQYFDSYHDAGFDMLKEAKYIEILPLGFIRGLDARNMTVVVDECQNTRELISVSTRKAADSRIIFLGDTSPFQIDRPGNTPKNNGLTKLTKLLKGAPYFQHISMKSLKHIVRSDEVRDVVRRLFKAHGENPKDWTI